MAPALIVPSTWGAPRAFRARGPQDNPTSNGGEFIEFTNVGDAAINLSGWSFDDNSRAPGSVSLSAFGSVAVGQSVILSESAAALFRTAWGLASTVSVIGGNTNNLGRADEINVYDGSGTLIDRLTYDDATIGGPRTQNVSGNILIANLGGNLANLALASFIGDVFGSATSTDVPVAFLANPGHYLSVPEPDAIALLAFGAVALLTAGRRGRQAA